MTAFFGWSYLPSESRRLRRSRLAFCRPQFLAQAGDLVKGGGIGQSSQDLPISRSLRDGLQSRLQVAASGSWFTHASNRATVETVFVTY